MKTMNNWQGNMEEYLKVGDVVDEEIYLYFLEVTSPITYEYNLVQIGEPVDHINGKATYSTLEKTANGWTYRGSCYEGNTKHIR